MKEIPYWRGPSSIKRHRM